MICTVLASYLSNIQCIWKLFRTLFPHFVTLQPYPKIDEENIYLINQHTIPYIGKGKTDLKTEIPYLHRYSDALL